MLSKANFCAFFAISPPFDLYFVGFFVHFVDDFDDLPLFSLFSGSFAEGQMEIKVPLKDLKAKGLLTTYGLTLK